jgi:hypothetical protein
LVNWALHALAQPKQRPKKRALWRLLRLLQRLNLQRTTTQSGSSANSQLSTTKLFTTFFLFAAFLYLPSSFLFCLSFESLLLNRIPSRCRCRDCAAAMRKWKLKRRLCEMKLLNTGFFAHQPAPLVDNFGAKCFDNIVAQQTVSERTNGQESSGGVPGSS